MYVCEKILQYCVKAGKITNGRIGFDFMNHHACRRDFGQNFTCVSNT
jgi:hypothetical protein